MHTCPLVRRWHSCTVWCQLHGQYVHTLVASMHAIPQLCALPQHSLELQRTRRLAATATRWRGRARSAPAPRYSPAPTAPPSRLLTDSSSLSRGAPRPSVVNTSRIGPSLACIISQSILQMYWNTFKPLVQPACCEPARH